MEPVLASRVAVLIPAWNQVDELIACLESFSIEDYPDYDVIVVNNGEDNTSEVVRRDYPWVILIEEGVNLGFCKANNIGLKYCLERDFEYVILLNADTKVLPGFIGDLVRVMQGDSRIGIAGAKNLLMENPAYMWGQYGKVTWGPILVKTVGRFKPDQNLGEPPKDVEWVICNGCIISRAALEKVGLFDEIFFHCNEDVDWSFRARAAGFRVVYADAVAILHKGGSSADQNREKKLSYGYFIARNAFVFAEKYASPLQTVKLFIFVWLGVVLRSAYFILISLKEAAKVMAAVTAMYLKDSLGGQRLFMRGIRDGLAGRLSLEGVIIAKKDPPPASQEVSASLERGVWGRIKIWAGL